MVSRFIRGAWNTYKKNAGQIIGAQLVYVLSVLAIVIVSVIPLVVAGAKTIFDGTYTSQDIMNLSGPFAVFFLGMILAVIAAIAIDTGRISIYADALAGREVRVSNMMRVAKEKLWTSLGSAILVTAIVAIVGVAVLFLGAALSVINVLMTPAIIITAILAVVLFSLLFSITKQAIAVGNRPAFVSVEESYNIVKRNYLEFLMIALTVALIGIFLTFARGLGTIVILFVLKPAADIAYTEFYIEKTKRGAERAFAVSKAPKNIAAAKPKSKTAKRKALKKARRKR